MFFPYNVYTIVGHIVLAVVCRYVVLHPDTWFINQVVFTLVGVYAVTWLIYPIVRCFMSGD